MDRDRLSSPFYSPTGPIHCSQPKGVAMARDPRKEGSRSRTRGKKGLPRRNAASRSAPKHARKSAAKAKSAKTVKANRGGAAALKQELNEAHLRQAASAEILKIIAISSSDPQPVFEAIVAACARLFRCDRSIILRFDGASYTAVAAASPDGPRKLADTTSRPIDPNGHFPSRAMVSQRTLHLPDWAAIELPEYEREMRRKLRINSALYLPLVCDGQCTGVLALTSRRTNNFDGSDIALAESFRDQAV